jgi:hypothetical protein
MSEVKIQLASNPSRNLRILVIACHKILLTATSFITVTILFRRSCPTLESVAIQKEQ